ncbi:hypothetical protein KVR01_012764 [Diaporthe batatas]|uniref:uncharacterized protein n=1 Tax=Diaporthe batatas TaxID=748121 RepID=UPI001D04E764|nr:uncharacterized protein KVR01_012764 [Diaporthe batatas]KAG8157380.1 hypothetical protein KVR01_012764 [Diaporthe batatas]
MCFHIIPLCPGCEEPSGLGEEVIYSDDVCCGHCPPEDVCGSTTRLMTKSEVSHPDFECSTPGCGDVRTSLSAAEEEAELQRARDHAKRFLRENHENCISLCILPFMDEPAPESENVPELPILGFRPVNKPNRTGLHGKSRPWGRNEVSNGLVKKKWHCGS